MEVDKEIMEELTNREKEVAKLIGLGYTNNDIAEKLVISHHTAKAHIASIYKKLNISNRIIVMKKIIDMGLVHIENHSGNKEQL